MKPKYLIIAVSLLCFTAFSTISTTENITWYNLKEAQQLAQEDGKKVLIYAEASWCGYCQKMENEVFPRQEIIEAMAQYYYPVRVDIESNNKIEFNGEILTESQFARKYRVQGTPTTFFVDQGGKILGAQPGFIEAEIFKNLLTFVGTDAYQSQSFEDYLKQQK